MAARNSPEQKNRFLIAQSRAMAAQRSKRARSRPTRPAVKSKVEVAAEQSATQAAAAVQSAREQLDDPQWDHVAFDPGDYTVAEVTDYLDKNPDKLQTVLDAEKAGKARAGVLSLGDD